LYEDEKLNSYTTDTAMAENGLETQNSLISSLNFATFSPQFVAKS